MLNQSSKSGEEILVTILPSPSSELLEKTVKQFIKQGTFFGGAADDVNPELNRLILDYYFETQADISRMDHEISETVINHVNENLNLFKDVMNKYKAGSKKDQDVSSMATMMNSFMKQFPLVNKESQRFFSAFLEIIEDDFLNNQGKLFKACFRSENSDIDKKGPFKFAVLHCMFTNEYSLGGTPKQIRARDCLLQVSREIMLDSASDENKDMLTPYKDFVNDIMLAMSLDAFKDDSSSRWVSPGANMTRWARDMEWFASSLRKSIVSAPSHVVITLDGFNGFDNLPEEKEDRTTLYRQLQIRGLLTKDGGITDRMMALQNNKTAFKTQFMFGSVGKDRILFDKHVDTLFEQLKHFANNKYGKVLADTKSLDTFKQQSLVDAKGWANVSKEHYDDLVSCYSGGHFKKVDDIEELLNNQLAEPSLDLLNLDETILTILRNQGVVDDQGYVTLQFQKLYFESKTQGTFIKDHLRKIDFRFDIGFVTEKIENQLKKIKNPLNLQQLSEVVKAFDELKHYDKSDDAPRSKIDYKIPKPLQDAYLKERKKFQELFCKEFLPPETVLDDREGVQKSLEGYAARLLAALKQEGAIVGGEIQCLDPQRLLENYGLPSEGFSIDIGGTKSVSVNLKKWLEDHSKHEDAIDRYTYLIINDEGLALTDQLYQDPKKASGPMYRVSIRPGKGLLNSFFVADELALPENYNVKVGVVNKLGTDSSKGKDKYRYWVKTKMTVDDIAKMLVDPNLTAQGRDFLLQKYDCLLT